VVLPGKAGLVPHLGKELVHRKVHKHLKVPPILPTAEAEEVRHCPLGDGVNGAVHPPDGGQDGDHPAAVDGGRAVLDQGPAQGGPPVTPIILVNDGGCRPRGRGRQEIGRDVVFNVLLGAQKGARPLSLAIGRHGGRRVGSVSRSLVAAAASTLPLEGTTSPDGGSVVGAEELRPSLKT